LLDGLSRLTPAQGDHEDPLRQILGVFGTNAKAEHEPHHVIEVLLVQLPKRVFVRSSHRLRPFLGQRFGSGLNARRHNLW
jgi:hypothetical protein